MTAPTAAPPSMQERLAAAEQRSAYLQGQLDARGQSQPAPQSQGRPPLSGCANGPQGRAVGNSALRTGAIVAGGAVAASVVGLAPVLVVAGVAVGVKMLVDKTRAALQRRQDRRVAQGGQRHGVGGALTRWAGQNKGPLAAGVGVGAAMLMTGAALLPAVAVGAAAVGLAKLVRRGLRERRANQQYRADLEYLRNLPGRGEQQAETAPRADSRSVGTEAAATPQPQRGGLGVPEATVTSVSASGVAVPTIRSAVVRGGLGERGAEARRMMGAQPPTRLAAVERARATGASPGGVVAVGQVAPVAPVSEFVARRKAQLDAEQAAAPTTTPAKRSDIRPQAGATGFPGRVPPGMPRTAVPTRSRGGRVVHAA